VVEPTTDEFGDEQHPAWALVGASRVSHSAPGAVLFDSDIRHQHYVVVSVKRATRRRNLSHDWKHGRQQIVEFAMSEAQWASFVSSMNTGDGVPATLQWDATQDDATVPGMPHAPRLKVSMDEVHNAASVAQEKVQSAFAAYAEKKTASNLRDLEIAIGHMTPNIDFVAKSLTEHAENVVQRARADVEAFVVTKARQLGLNPADLGGVPELGVGSDEVVAYECGRCGLVFPSDDDTCPRCGSTGDDLTHVIAKRTDEGELVLWTYAGMDRAETLEAQS
jgi:rubrerythrin